MTKSQSSAVQQGAKTPYRLASLDILRGFDLFMLVFLQPIIWSLGSLPHPGWLDPIIYQLDHEVWEGFRCWDLVMPLFLFMTGASMPFSLSKYDGRKPDAQVYRKITRRFLLLFLLGMVVQGNLLGFNFKYIYLYTNTLQSIATGYLVSALLLLHCRVRTQIIWTAALLVVYTIPMMLWGDYTREGSFAFKVDELILGRFRGDLSYTWIWSSLTFSVTVMLGTFAGRMIRLGRDKQMLTVRRLLVTGLVLVVCGWLWSFNQPVIKRIWTGSMTLLSGGYCFLLMGAFYYWIDVRGHHRGLDWLKIYGMNSIAAYIMGEAINFRSIARSLSYGLEQYMGDYYSVWLTFANFLIVFLILLFMYRRKIYLKI